MPTKKSTTKVAGAPLQGVVVPVDNRSSVEHVQDACFEGLIRTYTKKEDWPMVELVSTVYGRVLTDRGSDDIPTSVQNSTKELADER